MTKSNLLLNLIKKNSIFDLEIIKYKYEIYLKLFTMAKSY